MYQSLHVIAELEELIHVKLLCSYKTLFTKVYNFTNYTKRYSATELDALGVVWAVKHFRHYIYGHYIIVMYLLIMSLLNPY